MTIRDRAQIELRRLPLLRHANRGLALDRFADLTHGGDVAFKGGLKRPQCDGIAIGCTCPGRQQPVSHAQLGALIPRSQYLRTPAK